MRLIELLPAQCPAARPFRRTRHARIAPAAAAARTRRESGPKAGESRPFFASVLPHRGRIVDIRV